MKLNGLIYILRLVTKRVQGVETKMNLKHSKYGV